MKTVLAGLFALFLFFSWHPQPVSAVCCDAFDNPATCTKPVGCLDGITRCDTNNDCRTGGFNGVTQVPGRTTPGGTTDTTGSTATGTQFDPLCNGGKGVTTALGCIPTEPSGFIKRFLDLGIGIAGGIAFLLILFGGFQILTSAGNPEKLNAGKELVGSAVTGLLLIIFSVFLLRVIGVNILGIPEFK